MLTVQIIKVEGIYSHEAGRQITKGPVLHYLPRAFIVGGPVPTPSGYLKTEFRPDWVPSWVRDGSMVTMEGDYEIPPYYGATENACWTLTDAGVYVSATFYVWDEVSDRLHKTEAIIAPDSVIDNYQKL